MRSRNLVSEKINMLLFIDAFVTFNSLVRFSQQKCDEIEHEPLIEHQKWGASGIIVCSNLK